MKAWVFILAFALAGCSSVGKLLKLSKTTPPALSVTPTANGPAVVQSGDAAQPARVVTTETQASIPVPAGAVITIAPPPSTPETQPTPPVTVTTKTTDITGPRSHTPPAPPTPNQLANADAVRQSYYLAGLLIVGAGFLFWRGHVKAALVASVCGVAVPVLANVASTEWAQRLFIAGACIAGALFAAWHFMNDKKPNHE